ncbi:MAG: hypothetical protein ACYCSN_07915 [Acidobacteriaceae bacterium]
MTQNDLRRMWLGISPMSYMRKFAETGRGIPAPETANSAVASNRAVAGGGSSAAGERSSRRSLVVYAPYDLTFRKEFSLEVLKNFDQQGIDYEARVLPCGHYTTGETPYKYIDAWYLGSFVYRAFKHLRQG